MKIFFANLFFSKFRFIYIREISRNANENFRIFSRNASFGGNPNFYLDFAFLEIINYIKDGFKCNLTCSSPCGSNVSKKVKNKL